MGDYLSHCERKCVSYFVLSLTLIQVFFFFFLQNKISNNIQINKLKVLKNKKYIYGEDEANIGMVFRGVCIYLKLPAFFELIATVKTVPVTVTEFGDHIQNTHH